MPTEPEPERTHTAGELTRARIANVLGLFTPVANAGMLNVSPRELRWMGIGAGVILWLLAGWAWWKGATWGIQLTLGAHLLLVVVGLIHPRWPEVPARWWIRFGTVLGHVVAIPIFSLLFYLVVTPTALIMRLSGRDPLRRGADPEESYWRPHEPPPPEKYERQF